jgi:Nop53 (60S ribosomal biogenesis)
MPKVKSKTAANRLAAINAELAENAEALSREKAVQNAADEALFVVDTKKNTKLETNANAALAGPRSKALIYVRPVKPAKPVSKVESKIIEKMARRVAAGEILPAAHSDKLARKPLKDVTIPVLKASEDVWADDGVKKAKEQVRLAKSTELEVPSVLIPPASYISGSKRKRPFTSSSAKDEESGDGVGQSGPSKGQKRQRASEGEESHKEEKKKASLTMTDATAAAGLSYNPSLKDHKEAMFVAAKNQLALEAASKPHIQVALQPARLLRESVPQLEDAPASSSSSSAKAGKEKPTASASLVAIKPKRADVTAAKRVDMVPLPEELTGSLRTMKRAPAAMVAKDMLISMRSTGLIGEKRRKGKAASRVSNKRVKQVEFPRIPASSFGPKDGEW